MMTSVSLRASLLAAALATALSAQAVNFTLVSAGYYLPSAGNIGSPNSKVYTEDIEDIVFQDGGAAPLGQVSYSVPIGSLPRTGNGSFIGNYPYPAPDRLNFALTISSFGAVGQNYQILGTWTATSGTGKYLGVTGGGDFETTFDPLSGNGTDSLASDSYFSGDIHTPTPEPATLAALGMGAVGLIRRRKRA